MPRWEPEPIWEGADAYVLGGGASLRSFDWALLRGRNVIGCNSAALRHGPELVPVNVFADRGWWRDLGCWKPGQPLPQWCTEEPRFSGERYVELGGMLVGVSPKQNELDEYDGTPWLRSMRAHDGDELGLKTPVFAGSSGAIALNLALILGARRVFLLGFDLAMVGGVNWHGLRREHADAHVYGRFRRELERIAPSLERVFPGRQVVNVTDRSPLDCFPRVSLEQHFAQAVAA